MLLSPQGKEQIKRLKPPPSIHMQVERCTCWKPALGHSKKTAKCMTSSCFFCHTQPVLYEVSFLRSLLGRSDMANTWVQTTALKDGNKASNPVIQEYPVIQEHPCTKNSDNFEGQKPQGGAILRLKCVELGATNSKLKQGWCRPFQDAKLQVVAIWQPPAIPKLHGPCSVWFLYSLGFWDATHIIFGRHQFIFIFKLEVPLSNTRSMVKLELIMLPSFSVSLSWKGNPISCCSFGVSYRLVTQGRVTDTNPNALESSKGRSLKPTIRFASSLIVFASINNFLIPVISSHQKSFPHWGPWRDHWHLHGSQTTTILFT